jgi:hypothetical protein
VQPIGHPAAQPFGHPAVQPFGHPAVQPFGHPAVQPFGYPAVQPFGNPVNATLMVPAAAATTAGPSLMDIFGSMGSFLSPSPSQRILDAFDSSDLDDWFLRPN